MPTGTARSARPARSTRSTRSTRSARPPGTVCRRQHEHALIQLGAPGPTGRTIIVGPADRPAASAVAGSPVNAIANAAMAKRRKPWLIADLTYRRRDIDSPRAVTSSLPIRISASQNDRFLPAVPPTLPAVPALPPSLRPAMFSLSRRQHSELWPHRRGQSAGNRTAAPARASGRNPATTDGKISSCPRGVRRWSAGNRRDARLQVRRAFWRSWSAWRFPHAAPLSPAAPKRRRVTRDPVVPYGHPNWKTC